MGGKILIIDDEPAIRGLLGKYLSKAGFDVTEQSSGQEAKRQVAGNTFHLAVLDLALADADGIEILEHFHRVRPELPVVILTGMGFEDRFLQESLQGKIRAFLTKTQPLEEILATLNRVLKEASAP